MEFLAYLTEGNVIVFLLLLLRFSAILTFFPFFDSQLVPISVRGAMAVFFDHCISAFGAFKRDYRHFA
ncbi:hypothetical protein [Helicobacter canis]|uniref:Flagellar biosynthesis protein n=1 Tax=Helicobacter canis TaxID=29419 RepID=A0A377JLJ6_9HELI|nr:hypothetical protein [Helicobacter canis]STP06550.1 flagellar biosynthesis protein [Helicobacter canis]